ncbi:MAG: ADOP family duplicated permease [Gemmatimonadales bacterium]
MLRDLLSDVRFRLRALFRREDVERELADELQLHVEIETDRLIAEGVPADEARRQTRLALGGVEQVKEATRDARGLVWVDAFRQDLGWAARSLRRSPGFTAAVVLTIALGLGANAALFGVIDRLMFRPPAYLRDPELVNCVYFYSKMFGRRDIPTPTASHTLLADIEDSTRSFDQVAGSRDGTAVVGTGTDAHSATVTAVTGTYFNFFNARPVRGRFIGADDSKGPAGSPVAVVSYAYWRDQLGGRADVVGVSIQVDSAIRTIIGVTPDGFVGITDGPPPALWIPAGSRSGTNVIVRRKAGVSESAATAELSLTFLRSYEAARLVAPRMMPVEEARPRAAVVAILKMRRPDAAPEAKLVPWLAGVGLIVLLIACANVCNLLLARALRRRREIAVRLALGVSRARLLAQLLTESLLLAAMGGSAGLIVGRWGAAILRTFLIPNGGEVAVVTDPRTLIFASCIALGVGILSGLAPAAHALRQDLSDGLKSGVHEGSYQRSRARSALLVLQVALSALLLVGAGLFVKSLTHVRALRLGYDVDPVLTAELNWRGARADDSTREALLNHLVAEVTTIPGVTHATRAVGVPFYWVTFQTLFVPGVDSVEGTFVLQTATPEYFATMGTRVLRGRSIAATDRADAPLVAIVSEGMAHALWPGHEALGRCFRVGADTAPCRTVVGIAENIKQGNFTDNAGLHYYLPAAQWHPGQGLLLVRVNGNASQYVETIRRRLQRQMPANGEIKITTLRELVDPKMKPWRLGATMFLAFGGLALIVAAVGLFAVIAYNVEQRSRDLGVRIAFGAESSDVLRLVVGQAMRFAFFGVAIGGAVALGAGRWMQPLLFRESPADISVYAIVAAALFAVALTASALPALRAARTDPNLVLRSE